MKFEVIGKKIVPIMIDYDMSISGGEKSVFHTSLIIKILIEQQWPENGSFNPLQVSRGFSYAWDGSKPRGERVIAESMQLNGEAIQPEQIYQVAASAFLMDGGDRFTGFAAGTNRHARR